MDDTDGLIHIGTIDVDIEHRHRTDPGLVFDLNGVVAEPYDQVGALQELALDLAPATLDATKREYVVLVD